MAVDTICHICGGSMKLVRRHAVADTVYHFMRCETCKREVARREED